MSVNRNKPHVVIIPEDDENRQIVNGFVNHAGISLNQIRVKQPAGGWIKAVEQAGQELKEANARAVAVIDFDDNDRRYEDAIERIPEGLRDRVAIVGCRKEPVDLRRAKLGSLEEIGGQLAEGRYSGSPTIWEHELLSHNAGEIGRVRQTLCPLLFASRKPREWL